MVNRPLLEREAEVTAIDELVARGGALVFEGPAGIGKTLLLNEAVRRGMAGGRSILRAGASELERAFPPTGKAFATTQTHWLRVHDDKVIEHWANRDDMGTAEQLGWVPPSPLFLLRSSLATRAARRALAAERG